ncbi:MAG: asparaginase, partial [Ilumatobacteraceae bacterium]
MTTGIVAAVDRNGVDESFHHGTVVVADPSGCRALVGDIDTVIYHRSSLKPLQTTAMLDAGLRL